VSSPPNHLRRADQIAKAKISILGWLLAFLVILIATGLAVLAATGSGLAGSLTVLGLALVLPVLATALRARQHKRNGLRARSTSSRRPPTT
jgi:hypothetical protein